MDSNELKEISPARLAVGRSGARPLTKTVLQFRADHARARDAVYSELSEEFIRNLSAKEGSQTLTTLCTDRTDFILNPPKGKKASEAELKKLNGLTKNVDVQIVVSDGLSAAAVEANIPDLLPILKDGLELENISFGAPVIVHYGRVAIADQIAHHVSAKIALNLIGERPGLSSATSLSAYITYNPGPHTISSDRTVVSNIHAAGTPPLEAGAYIVQLCKKILDRKMSGVKLQKII
jgi:ethanolamine ammonia-lyase small subunit